MGRAYIFLRGLSRQSPCLRFAAPFHNHTRVGKQQRKSGNRRSH